MAPTKNVDITAVWGALVDLIRQLERLAKLAADQLEAEQGGRKL